MRKCIVIALVLLISSTTTGAQDIPHFVEKLTTAEGLSSNVITALAQDDNGFLWIGTPDGLNRYDGTEIVHYTNTLPHSYINCLLKLPGNGLAIGTQAGLSFYNTATGVFQNFYSHHQPSLDDYNNTIIALAVDARGNCWAASKNCIYIFTPQHRLKKILSSSFTAMTAARERLSFVEKMLPLSDGDVLLYLHDGWAMYSATADRLIHYQRPPAFLPTAAGRLFKIGDRHLLSIPKGKDSLLLLDEHGREESSCFFPYNKYPYISWAQQAVALDAGRVLLLLHNFGFLILSLHRGETMSLSPLLFEDSEYKTALCDLQGSWWLATTREGLQKISAGHQYFTGTPLIDRQTGRPVRYEVTSCNRLDSTLWVFTYGDGFFEMDLPSGRQRQHRLTHTGNDIWANFIWNSSRQGKDTLFLGTQIGLFWYSTRTGKSGRLSAYRGKPRILDTVAITTQFLDSHGLLWMGLGKGKGLCTYERSTHRFDWYPGNSPSGYPLRYPTDIAEDPQGDLWFTNDASNLLVRWHRRSRQFETVGGWKKVGPLKGICCPSDSILWIGDITCGLLKYNLRNHHLCYYGHEQGLVNCHISDIREDERKRLWLVTEGGLACFDPCTKTFTNYTTKDGLPVPYPTSDFFYDSRDRRLYSGGHGACFFFNPGAILDHPARKNTFITAFNARQNNVTIQYAAVDLLDGPSTNYAYRLVGADTAWIMVGRQRQINFSRLPPGRYTFQVHATVNGPIAAVSFRIAPRFTQTTGFYALLLLVFAIGVGALYRYRQKQVNQTLQIRGEISRNLHDEVGAGLTNISLSSLLAQRQLQGEGTVSHILERIYEDSQRVSEAMREIVWSINPNIDTLGEAVPRMIQYAAHLLEANNIELQAEIVPEVEKLRLNMKQRRDVYLIFKEAIHNMVRHSKATKAIVQFYLSGKTLLMKISDDGNGFDTCVAAAGNGLRNMQERARQHRWKLEIRSLPQHGTTVVLNTTLT
ncbi:ligand-binding sensor domain-containing protein [Dinghuibacter silviterrae]|uniref:histidine kinase n=1 Tax=Dinghuibacter silviterrae TaxID=1539049 RepID=A0A4R8DT65_9BACT|nr:two-component regulator propeller domain-containing protein [Dinghuibacter silviterrae]TDX01460.1 signal transduction histidine kinase [Dinghuibacter silviterrae]